MQKSGGLLRIHSAVFLFGLAGLFGKLLFLPPIIIVLGRVFFATASLLVVLIVLKEPFRLQTKVDHLSLSILGLLLAIHWITFFESIQLSTVGIGLLTFSTFPVFTALLEPWFSGEKLRMKDLGIASVAATGVALVVPEFSLSNDLTVGAFWGVVSGATFALLSILNRRHAQRYSGYVIAFYQDLSATMLLLPFLLVYDLTIKPAEIGLLILLGVVFTGLAHSLFIGGLKSISAKTASIIATLEPFYGIAAAAYFLGEEPGIRIFAGGVVILGVAVYETLNSRGSSPPRAEK